MDIFLVDKTKDVQREGGGGGTTSAPSQIIFIQFQIYSSLSYSRYAALLTF